MTLFSDYIVFLYIFETYSLNLFEHCFKSFQQPTDGFKVFLTALK